MKRFISAGMIAALTAGLSAVASAEERKEQGKIEFTGSIYNVCRLTTDTVQVGLEKVPSADLNGKVGNKSEEKAVDLRVECDEPSDVSLTIGAADEGESNSLIPVNDADNKQRDDVGVAIYKEGEEDSIKLGKDVKFSVEQGERALPLTAAYVSMKEQVAAGEANGSVNFTITLP